MLEIADIKTIFENGEIEKADELLDSFEGEKNVNYWLLKGGISQKKQLWGQAINAFQKVLEIDAGNKEADSSVEIINNILNFSNPEMFNV